MSADTVYRGREAALLTQHGKEQILAPILGARLGCAVRHVTGYDTDQLGTFTREIPRAGTQIEAARRKARTGMSLARLPLGIASEGAFGADPMIGMLPWNLEILVWLDDERGLEVVGRAQGPACHRHRLTGDWADVEALARQVGFPQQGLILRPDHETHPGVRKDAVTWESLADQFRAVLAQAGGRQVFVETDGRAHVNPTRRQMIHAAAEDLTAALASTCPRCSGPGFWRVKAVGRLPCRDCGAPSQVPAADRYECPGCHHQADVPRPGEATADPGQCEYCNP